MRVQDAARPSEAVPAFLFPENSADSAGPENAQNYDLDLEDLDTSEDGGREAVQAQRKASKPGQSAVSGKKSSDIL